MVEAYLALFATGFRRQARYRGALLTGLLANVFFGVFRSAIFITLYKQRDEVAGLDVRDAVTYVWVLQTLFGVVFAPWIWEFPESVRSGDFVMQLLKPGEPFGRLLAVDTGRATFAFLARGAPQILLPGLFFDMRLPTTPAGIAALAGAFFLTTVAAFEYRFLFGSAAFWTADFRGWWSLLFGAIWFTAGFVVPVEYFPGALRWFAEHGPVATLLAVPVKVATERHVVEALLTQLVWVVLLGVACRLLMGVAERRLVVHGG